MFRCEKCGTVVAPGTPAHQLVVQERSKEYPTRREAAPTGRSRFPREHTVDRGGEGHEIVRELKVCPECSEKFGAQ